MQSRFEGKFLSPLHDNSRDDCSKVLKWVLLVQYAYILGEPNSGVHEIEILKNSIQSVCLKFLFDGYA